MFFRVLSTEVLKLKRTLALWMVLVTPLVMVLLQFAISAKKSTGLISSGADAWAPMVRQTVEVWTLLMMPMFVTLETSLLAGLEHTGKNWKSLLALPAPRWTLYVSKLVITIALLWMAHAVLVMGTIGCGWLLKLIFPGLNLGSMPLNPFVVPMLRVSVDTPSKRTSAPEVLAPIAAAASERLIIPSPGARAPRRPPPHRRTAGAGRRSPDIPRAPFPR